MLDGVVSDISWGDCFSCCFDVVQELAGRGDRILHNFVLVLAANAVDDIGNGGDETGENFGLE